jgi:hypothetical protein
MTNTVLVDAGPLIALFDKDDFYHKPINALVFTSSDKRYKLYPQGQISGQSTITIPFEPIIIPENATSVTFEIRWDLTGLIQQYTGRKGVLEETSPGSNTWITTSYVVDDVPNDGNDLFVLKNNYWEGLSITATVQ